MSSDYYCKMCDITCSGKAPYDQHLDSAKHLKRAKTYVGQPSPEPTASSNTNASVPSFTKDLSPPPSVPPASTTGSLSADTMRVLLEWNHPLGYHPYCEICYLPLHGEGNADLHFSPKNLIHQQKLAARKQIRETVPNYSCKVCSEVFPSETVMLQHFHSEIHTTTTQLKSSLEKFILVYDTYQKLKEARRNFQPLREERLHPSFVLYFRERYRGGEHRRESV